MIFTYALVGCEGSAHDTFVLREAENRGFKIPTGSFLLGDAGYSLQENKILTPYRGVRYHLREWYHLPVQQHPQNSEELFNLRHAQMRNVVERSIGLLKRRFKVIRMSQLEFQLASACKVIYACIAIHNFIRRYATDDDFAGENDSDNEDDNNNDNEVDLNERNNQRRMQAGKAWRDSIALNLFNQYRNV